MPRTNHRVSSVVTPWISMTPSCKYVQAACSHSFRCRNLDKHPWLQYLAVLRACTYRAPTEPSSLICMCWQAGGLDSDRWGRWPDYCKTMWGSGGLSSLCCSSANLVAVGSHLTRTTRIGQENESIISLLLCLHLALVTRLRAARDFSLVRGFAAVNVQYLSLSFLLWQLDIAPPWIPENAYGVWDDMDNYSDFVGLLSALIWRLLHMLSRPRDVPVFSIVTITRL